MGLASPMALAPAVPGQALTCLQPRDGALAQEPRTTTRFGHYEQ